MAAKLLVNALPVALALFLTTVTAAPQESEKVRVAVYYESYCPDSIKFLTQQLYPVYKTPLASYMNLTLVPYGLSNYSISETGTYNFECHHGAKECTGNMIMACILNVYKNQDEQLKLMNCTSDTISKNPKLEEYPAPQCASELKLDYTVVQNCVRDNGNQLLAALGNKTNQLQPKLTNVPTIVFKEKNDPEASKLAQKDFKSALCAQITGKKPEECSKSSAASFHATILTVFAAVILTRM